MQDKTQRMLYVVGMIGRKTEDTLIAGFIEARGVTRVPTGEAQGIYKVHMKGRKHAPKKTGRGRKGRQR